MKTTLYPFKLKPLLKDYIWGGVKLKTEWGKESLFERVAESWEFSAFPRMESRVESGKYQGYTLLELHEEYPDIFGARADDFPLFPLLVKLIDADKDLSVQVHPDDGFSLINERELGKTEAWYIADASENAAIYYGFSRDTTDAELEASIKDNTICGLLNKVEVKAGDFFFVEAGTVHAILSGVTVIEVQESSSVTYRFYDYGRKDANGKERELHIEKALKVVNKKARAVPLQDRIYEEFNGYKTRKLAKCKYFDTKEVIINGEYPLFNASSFITFTVVSGSGKFGNDFPVAKGDTFFIHAGLSASLISENLTIIQTSL